MKGYIGILDSGEPFYIDIDSFFERHVAILSRTGSGKSYMMGVLIEELIKSKIPILIIDTHGEYRTLLKPNSDNRRELFEKFKIAPKGFPRQVRIFSPKARHCDIDFYLSDANLSVDDISNLYPGRMKDNQRENLHRIIFEMGKDRYTLDDVMRKASEIKTSSRYTLLSMLKQVQSMGLFHNHPTRATDLVKKGYATIVDLNLVPKRLQITIVNYILRAIWEARRNDKIPPFVLAVEETHIYCPQQKSVQSSDIVKDIASEGRKFGIGLCVITQRPSRINKDVLSQPNTQIYLKVTNPNDLKAIYDSIEETTPELRNELKNLQRGVCLISGIEDEKSVKVHVRIRHSKHGGKSKAFTGGEEDE